MKQAAKEIQSENEKKKLRHQNSQREIQYSYVPQHLSREN